VRGESDLEEAVERHREYIASEILALDLKAGTLPEEALLEQEWQVNDHSGTIAITRA
jgi:hypothetical protein